MKIGLYFGSFNPIHSGHLIVAQQLLQAAELEKIWFVLSPQNPLKKHDLLSEDKRMLLLEQAIAGNNSFEICEVELTMPKPSYTIDTLNKLKDLFPGHQFSILMGGDNFESFEKWKSYEMILRDYEIHVYLRGVLDKKWKAYPNIRIYDLPYLHISATYVREKVKAGKEIRYLVPENILEQVKSFYSE